MEEQKHQALENEQHGDDDDKAEEDKAEGVQVTTAAAAAQETKDAKVKVHEEDAQAAAAVAVVGGDPDEAMGGTPAAEKAEAAAAALENAEETKDAKPEVEEEEMQVAATTAAIEVSQDTKDARDKTDDEEENASARADGNEEAQMDTAAAVEGYEQKKGAKPQVDRVQVAASAVGQETKNAEPEKDEEQEEVDTAKVVGDSEHEKDAEPGEDEGEQKQVPAATASVLENSHEAKDAQPKEDQKVVAPAAVVVGAEAFAKTKDAKPEVAAAATTVEDHDEVNAFEIAEYSGRSASNSTSADTDSSSTRAAMISADKKGDEGAKNSGADTKEEHNKNDGSPTSNEPPSLDVAEAKGNKAARRAHAQPGAKRGGRRDTARVGLFPRWLGRRQSHHEVGDLVEAEWEGSRWWYVGYVEGAAPAVTGKKPKKGFYHVVFADGDEADVDGRHLKPLGASGGFGRGEACFWGGARAVFRCIPHWTEM